MREAALIHNPAAGSQRAGAKLDRIVEALATGGRRVKVLATTARGQGTELCARFLAEAGPDADVIVLGGDGTLNEAVTGAFEAGLLGERADDDPGGPRFGVLPAGTTNVVAADLGVPRDPLEAARAIASGGVRLMDLGRCEAAGVARPFLLACGVGFDADAARRVRPGLKRVLGRGAYWAAALEALGHPWSLSIDHDGPAGSGRDETAASAIVGNTRLYAGCVRLRAGSAYDDGLLDLVLFPSIRLSALLQAGLTGLRASVAGAAGTRGVAATRVVIRAAPGGEGDTPMHVDAEPWGGLPAELTVLRRRLRILVP